MVIPRCGDAGQSGETLCVQVAMAIWTSSVEDIEDRFEWMLW